MKITNKLIKISNYLDKIAKSGSVSLNYEFDYDDFNLDKLEELLKKSGIRLSEIAELDSEGNIEELKKKFWDALDSFEIEAECSFYKSSDSEGYPEPNETEIETTYPKLKILGKSIDIESVIIKRTKEKIEDKLFEKFMDEY
jgi:hypothetical protein